MNSCTDIGSQRPSGVADALVSLLRDGMDGASHFAVGSWANSGREVSRLKCAHNGGRLSPEVSLMKSLTLRIVSSLEAKL